jgi:hypothetical protein
MASFVEKMIAISPKNPTPGQTQNPLTPTANSFRTAAKTIIYDSQRSRLDPLSPIKKI